MTENHWILLGLYVVGLLVCVVVLASVWSDPMQADDRRRRYARYTFLAPLWPLLIVVLTALFIRDLFKTAFGKEAP